MQYNILLDTEVIMFVTIPGHFFKYQQNIHISKNKPNNYFI